MDNLSFSKDLHVSAMVQIGKLNTNIDLLNLASTLNINKNLFLISKLKNLLLLLLQAELIL